MERSRGQRLRPGCWMLAILLAPCASALHPAPLQDAYWRFEEGPVDEPVEVVANYLWDSTGNNNHMQTQNEDTAPVFTADVPAAVVPATGEPNTLALRFDGIQFEGEGDEIFTSLKSIDNPADVVAFTMEGSFKLDNVVPGSAFNQSIFGKDSNVRDDGEPTATLRVRGEDALLEWRQIDRASNLVSVVGTERIFAGRWYHAAVVNDGSKVTLYLDAGDGKGYVERGSAAVDGALFEFEGIADPPFAWVVGRSMRSGAKVDFAGGVIDEVRLSARALDPTEFLFTTEPSDLTVLAIEKLPGPAVRVIFEDANPQGETYGLAGSPFPSGPFAEETEAVITDLGKGRIQADVPVGSQTGRYFKGSSRE